jgi:hypothetical protein
VQTNLSIFKIALGILLTASSLWLPAVQAAEPDFDLCTVQGREKLWAQKRLNADLMNQYIDAHHLRDPKVRVRLYVIDTGFDSAQIPNLVHPESFHAEPGVYGSLETKLPGNAMSSPQSTNDQSLVGDPLVDTGGHGTMVVSVIGAKDGIGVAPHTDISLLRVTTSATGSDAERTDNSFLDYALLKACTEGHAADPNGLVILNSSWAIRASEDGELPLAKRNPALITHLLDQGCLVLQAAGNDAFVGPLSPTVLDQGPVLSVSATEPFNSFASFSSLGQVAAPGENVFALASHFTHPNTRKNTCAVHDELSQTPTTFISGTSFSSPMTAGIAAEVTGVLRTLHPFTFAALSPPQKIQLVIRILEASAQSGDSLHSIDGLRAILIAERWNLGVPGITELRSSLSTAIPEICGSAPEDYHSKRMFASACQESQKKEAIDQVLVSLGSQALAAKAFESAAGFFLSANADDASIEKFSNAYVTSKVAGSSADDSLNDPVKQLQLRAYLDASFSEWIMPAHLRVNKGQARFLMTGLLSSWSTEGYLERGPGRGSEPILKSLVDNLEQMNGDDVTGILTDFTDTWLKELKPTTPLYNANSITTLIRVLNELRAREAFLPIASKLDALEKKILLMMDIFPATYGETFDAIAAQGEVYEDRGYIFEFFKRHAEDLELYSEMKSEYLAENAGPTDLAFLARVGNVIPNTDLWNLCSSTLKTELSAITLKVLLMSSPEQVNDWITALALESTQTIHELDDIAYHFSYELNRLRPGQRLNSNQQAEAAAIEAMISNPAVSAALPNEGIGMGRSGIYILKASSEYELRKTLPTSLLKALEKF